MKKTPVEPSLFKTKTPTFYAWWDRRQKKRANRLPAHLRPPPVWPVWIQLALNAGVFYTLWTVILDQDEFVTDHGPAIALVVCMVVLLYTLTQAIRYKNRYKGLRGIRLAKLNLLLTGINLLMWPAAIVTFLP